MELITIAMELNISDNDRMINNMEKVKKYGLMGLDMKAIILMEKKKVKEVFFG